MATIKIFRDLQVWQKAHTLVLLVYKLTSDFPKTELFGLTSQVRRSAASVPTNIVEGFRRRNLRDSLHFYNIADASLEETKYHFLLAKDLEYIKKAEHDSALQLCEEVGKLLTRWIQVQRSYLPQNKT